MLTVEPERAAKVQHKQTKTLDKRFIRDAAEQLAHGRSIADHARLDALSEPRAACNTASPPATVDAVFAGYVSRFVLVRYFHLQ